nr:type II and III secretion system protein family protein [uncultured Cohaesibacter sp.]
MISFSFGMKMVTHRGLSGSLLPGMILVCLMALFSLAPSSGAFAGTEMHLNASSANGRDIEVGLNKSVVIETPRDVRDVLVSSPSVADAVVRTPRRVYIIGMAIGQANVILFDGNGNQIASFDVNVARDNASLASLLRRMIPSSNIRVDGVGEGVALSGSVERPADAEKAMDLAATYVGDRKKVSNYISVEAREQVQIRVTVAEVERSVIKQLGINMGGELSRGIFSGAGVISNPFSVALESMSDNAVAMSLGGADNYLTTTVQAMERNGLIRTLAEPNLTAISGEKADFLAGGEFPIPVGIDDGKIVVEFKQYGVALSFRPIVLSENRISLKIKSEVSEISSDQTVTVGDSDAQLTIPGLRTRRSSTTLELPSGGTMAMAGLLRDDVRKNIDGFPYLKDLPVLGALFRSRDYKRNQTELVFFVTPYIVQPVAKSKVAMPTKNVEPSSDMNDIFLGALTRRYDMVGGNGRRGVKYNGRFGYSYE